MMAAEEEDAEEELSSDADTPEVGCHHTVAATRNTIQPLASVTATYVSGKVCAAQQMLPHTYKPLYCQVSRS